MVDVPNTFVPGEVASATEVNDNFNALRDGINQNSSYISNIEDDVSNLQENKADKNGNSSEPFKVGTATLSTHAINKGTLERYIGNLVDYISGLEIVRDDDHNVLVYDGQCYDQQTKQTLLILSTSSGEERGSTVLEIGTQINATYNIFITGDVEGEDIELNATTGSIPDNSAPRFRKIGEVGTDGDGNISSIVYYGSSGGTSDIPHQISNVAPDYSTVEVLTPNTEYTANEPTWVYMFAVAQNKKTIYYTINGVNYKFSQNRNEDTDTSSGVIMLLLSYGDRYKLPTGSSGSYHEIKRFKCRGV